MSAKKKTNQLEEAIKNLTRSFQRWDDIMENGCYDPFHCDGVNLNLVRNHIIYEKKQIDEFLKEEHENSFLSTPYPDIYHRPTPEKVSYDYMVKPDEIRSRAVEQLTKYEQDPNFCYLRDHFNEAFPNGETKATKEAGIYPGKFNRFIRFRPIVEKDDLVGMRNLFRVPYEEHIQELTDCANELRSFLHSVRSQDENTPITDEVCDEEYEELAFPNKASDEPFNGLEIGSDDSLKKNSLDEQIQAAKIKADTQDEPPRKEKTEQLSFFELF